MSELLKKYDSIDQSKLNEATVKILNRVKSITSDFTTEDDKNNKIAEQVLNEVMKKNPDAIKIIKREPKTAPKKAHKATHTAKTKKSSAPTAKKSENNIMSVAKEIQKAGESWKDAMERAKQVLKERKEKVVEKQKTELQKLYALVKTKKELKGFANSDISRDSVRDAKPRGARFVTKEGFTSNQYKKNVPNKLGRKYWETRDRHADRLAPNYPKDMPLLENGGSVSNERMFNFLKDDLEKLEIAINDGDKEEVERFFSYWGYHLKSLENKGFTENYNIMYNFLKDDLNELENAINEGNTEEIERFFSYWLGDSGHLKSLKMANGGSLPFMTDPNFGNFQNTGMFEEGGLVVKNNQDLEEVAKYMFNAVKKRKWDLKDLIYYFEKENNFDYKYRVKIWDEMNGYEMRKTYENILEMLKRIVEANGKKFELGGAFMMTDLAGHTGGSDGIGNQMPLSGVSGTYYTGLVGETGAMSSGEMFENGGGIGGKVKHTFEVGQTISYPITKSTKLDKSVRNIMNKYAEKELVIDEIITDKPYNTAKVSLKSTGEKLTGEVILNPRYITVYPDRNKNEKNVKIKDWYLKNYPTDDLGEELNDDVTFEDMWNEDYEKYNIYQVMGVGDSVIRERLFEHLAEIKGVSYDVVYRKLFSSDGFYADGGSLGKALYVEYSSYFTSNKYDEEKIMSVLQSIGAKNIRLENDRGWFNQPEVVVFNGDKNKAKEALNEAFDTNYIRVSEKDWRTKKMADGGAFGAGYFAKGGAVNMNKHVWEGWTVGSFIEELEPSFNQIMSGGSWQKPFKTKEEVKEWTMDNQPYYKKNIPDVVNYFWAKVQSKDDNGYYANGGETDGYTLNHTVEFTTSDEDSYLSGNIGGDMMDLIDVENIGDNRYSAIAKSYSVVFEGLKGQELEDEVYNQINEMFATNDDIEVDLESVKIVGKFELGGAMAQNQQVINDASQSYVNYYINEGASQGMYKKGGAIPNNYKGRTLEDVWNSWTLEQKEHFLHDHFDIIQAIAENSGETIGHFGEIKMWAYRNAEVLPMYIYSPLSVHLREGQYASGGSLGKALYVEYSSYFTSNKYDEEKIMSVLQSIGAKNIRLENDRGWFNQPEVVVFNGDKNKAQEALNEAFDTNYIRVSEKDWRTKKMADGGSVDDSIIDELWNGYASAVLFTETDSDSGEPLDSEYSVSDFDEETESSTKKMLAKFYLENKDAIEESELDLDTIGNDIWYTRSGQGAGFFDHNLDSEIEEQLTKGAKALGEYPSVETYDGKISVRGGRVFAKGGSLKNAKELSEQGRFELKVLQGLSGFRNGLNINGLYEVLGFSNYRFNQYATESQAQKVKKALNYLIEKGFVDESALGYEITKKGADYRREFNYGSYAKGGFVGTVEFNAGDVVWQKDEKRYATVMNNYGDPVNGDFGDIRLDTTGNTSIFTYDKKFDKTGYNLVKVGEKGDTGKFTPDVLVDMKKSANRLIDSRKESKDKEGVAYYQEVYKRLLDGEFDSMTGAKATASKKSVSSIATYVPNRDVKELSVVVKGELRQLKGSDILDGVYVKNSAQSKPKVDANAVFAKILKDAKEVKQGKSKRFDASDLKKINLEMVQKLAEAGYSEQQIRNVILGYAFDNEILADNELEYEYGVFSYEESYIKQKIDALVEAQKNKEFVAGIEYPNFDWQGIIKKYKISSNPKDIVVKNTMGDGSRYDYYYEVFVGENIVLGHNYGYKTFDKNGKLKDDYTEKGKKVIDPTKINSWQKEREYKSGFNGGYWYVVSSKIETIDNVLKTLLSQKDGYCKELELYSDSFAKTLKENNVEYADGGLLSSNEIDKLDSGFTISQLDDMLRKMFPYSFGVDVFKAGKNLFDYDLDDKIKDDKLKLYFYDKSSNRELNYEVHQGQENTYFDFMLFDEEMNTYIGTFGFKDRGDVDKSYITKFVSFLHDAYHYPFQVRHSVMANGGFMSDFYAKGGKFKKYIDHDDIESVTLDVNTNYVTFSGKDVLNGANIMEDGGDLSKIATYFPVSKVIKVELKNGETVKPVNGYWLKKGAKPYSKPSGTPASKIDETKAHFKIENGEVFVDSNFVNQSQNNLPNSELKHYGFGEFYLDTPDGQIDFARKEDKTEGFVGRTHKLRGDNELILKLIKAMSEKGRFESGQKLLKFREEPKQVASASTSSGSDLTKLKKGDRVLLKDGSSTREAIVTEDGLDSQKRVRVRPNGFPFDISVTLEENNKTYVIKKLMSGGSFANGGSVGSYDVVIDGDWDEPKKFKTFSLAKKWIYENIKNHNSLELVDSYGDTIYVDGDSTKEDLEWLFSNEDVSSFAKGGMIDYSKDGYVKAIRNIDGKILKEVTVDNQLYRYNSIYKTYNSVKNNQILDKSKFSDGGGISDYINSPEYKEIVEKMQKLTLDVKSRVIRAVGIDSAIEFYDADYPVRPYQLLEKAVRSGFITLDDINEKVIDSAMETAQDSEDDEEVGSSDFTSYLHNFLDEAGFKVGYVNGRLTREFANGGSISEDISECKKLVSAFCKEFGDMFGLDEQKILNGVKFRDYLGYGATVFVSLSVDSNISDLKVGETKPRGGSITFTSDINPNGVTGKDDIARTYSIDIEIKGSKRYTQRRTEEGTYFKAYKYGRTIEEVMDKTDTKIIYDLYPLEKKDDLKFKMSNIFADGGFFDSNEGFMRADNNRNFRYPEKEVYVETIDEPIDLMDYDDQTNDVEIVNINEDIDLTDDNRIRAKLTQPSRGTYENFLKINPSAFEFMGNIPMPSSNKHKND